MRSGMKIFTEVSLGGALIVTKFTKCRVLETMLEKKNLLLLLTDRKQKRKCTVLVDVATCSWMEQKFKSSSRWTTQSRSKHVCGNSPETASMRQLFSGFLPVHWNKTFFSLLAQEI